jgi:hypothetical protein
VGAGGEGGEGPAGGLLALVIMAACRLLILLMTHMVVNHAGQANPAPRQPRSHLRPRVAGHLGDARAVERFEEQCRRLCTARDLTVIRVLRTTMCGPAAATRARGMPRCCGCCRCGRPTM